MPLHSIQVSNSTPHQRIVLSPIKKPKKKKVLHEKQKNFVLDCTNHDKAKLQQYNCLRDKYLNYCVVKIPKKKRTFVNAKSYNDMRQQKSIKTPDGFRNFLENKRGEVMARLLNQGRQQGCQKENENFQRFLETQKQGDRNSGNDNLERAAEESYL